MDASYEIPDHAVEDCENECARHRLAEARWVIEGLTGGLERLRGYADRLETALLDASRFIPTTETIELNPDTNRIVVEIMASKR
jgi:hypothetical protein